MSRSAIPSLCGLVLAGGQSRRMGRDKASLKYAGRPQVIRATDLLARHCADVWVSVRADQATRPPYDELTCVTDDAGMGGPAAGLLAAWQRRPEAALLVLAADMPRVDDALLSDLIEARNPEALATAFVHPDGTPEPLCTIWEPRARAVLLERRTERGVSLRDVLLASRIRRVEPADAARLASVDSPEAYRVTSSRIGRE